MLGGAEYMGQMQLPNGSENRVFRRGDGQVVMAVWNAEPTREKLYLGEQVRQYDLLGRSVSATADGREQVIDVGPTPSFVLGLHEAITRWRMHMKFEKNQVPSVFSKPHHNSLSFKNFFPQGVGGTMKIVVLEDGAPGAAATPADAKLASGFSLDRWTIEPPQATFQLPTEGEMKFPFDIKLKDALFGKQPMRIDFTVEADERYQFSVYHQMEVGTEDLTLHVKSRLDKEGTLIVEQRMTNSAGRLADFKCYLRVRGHQPQRMQVYRLGPNPDRKIYRFAEGAELIGETMMLEIEELNGPRVLKYRFVAGAPQREPVNIESTDSPHDPAQPESNEPPPALARHGS
jgi:hypothetical protein